MNEEFNVTKMRDFFCALRFTSVRELGICFLQMQPPQTSCLALPETWGLAGFFGSPKNTAVGLGC